MTHSLSYHQCETNPPPLNCKCTMSTPPSGYPTEHQKLIEATLTNISMFHTCHPSPPTRDRSRIRREHSSPCTPKSITTCYTKSDQLLHRGPTEGSCSILMSWSLHHTSSCPHPPQRSCLRTKKDYLDSIYIQNRLTSVYSLKNYQSLCVGVFATIVSIIFSTSTSNSFFGVLGAAYS